MGFFEMAVLGAVAGTVMTVSIYVYLFFSYREKFMGIWLVSWLCYFARLVLLDRQTFALDNYNYVIGYASLTVLNAFCLAWGINDFMGKPISSRAKIFTGGVLGGSFLLLATDVPFELKAFLPATFFGVVYIWTGIVFLRNINIKGFGVWLTGLSIILLGIHGLDFILLHQVAWVVPWAYLLDAVLRFAIALGTLLVYLEKTRKDLVCSRDRYRLLADNAVDIIYRLRISPSPRMEYISPSITTITGYAVQDFYNDAHLLEELIHPADRANFETFLRTPEVRTAPLVSRLITRAKQQVWIEQTKVPVYSETGQFWAVEGVIRNITLRRQFEHDMARLDSLNTIGQMAANLAHEVRNPMTTIRGYLQMLSQSPELSRYEERFGFMIEELDRANSIISEYLSFCKDKVVDLKPCQLNNTIKSLYPLLQADANASNCRIVLDLADIPATCIDEKEIRQLMLNLVRNGLEAMSGGGMITIRTFTSNNSVVLTIEDQGAGIPPHILENLGTPFMTTKESGTGLGLAVCYRIANRHQAEIKVETGSAGTAFSIHFPLDNVCQ